jgi:hypothetical protein
MNILEDQPTPIQAVVLLEKQKIKAICRTGCHYSIPDFIGGN